MTPFQILQEIAPSVTFPALLNAIGSVEREQVDFKRQPAKLREIIPAMAMSVGGVVILGISNDRRLVGCALDQSVHDDIRRASSDVEVDVDVLELDVEGTQVVVVGVPEVRGRLVTTPNGRLLRRVGSDNKPLVGDSMARFVAGRVQSPGESEFIAAGTDPDLDLGAINRVLVADGRDEIDRDGVPRALLDLRLAERTGTSDEELRITRGAVVLFSRDPRVEMPGARIQAIRREGIGPGPGPVRRRAELHGPLQELTEAAMDFVRDTTTSHEVVTGTYRTTLPEYPEAAIREAVLNALAHRDYRLVGATVDLTVWDDRLELRSPGPLPGHVTLDNIRDEHYSTNPRMMAVLKTLRLVEEYGEGVDRMFEEMAARSMPPPSFSPSARSVTVTLWNRATLSVEAQAWLGTLTDLRLEADERRVLAIARAEGSVTPRRLRGLSDSDEGTLLSRMASRGLLVRVGRRGGTRYLLSDEIRIRAGSASIVADQRRRDLLRSELERRGSLSTAEAATFLGDDDRQRTRRTLNDLCDEGAAEAVGNTSARRYRPR